jgi:hypothetical protein
VDTSKIYPQKKSQLLRYSIPVVVIPVVEVFYSIPQIPVGISQLLTVIVVFVVIIPPFPYLTGCPTL